MSAVRQVTHVVGRTNASAPKWQVQIRTGTHHLVADEPAGAGGGDAGPNPFRLLLSGLAACTAMTLRMYAERKGWSVSSIEVLLDHEAPEEGQATIHRVIALPADVPEEQRARLAEIAEKTPVTVAVRAGTPISTTITVSGL
jgi:putative redox protein